MKVVSNTSPICYLLLIDAIQLLPELFGEVRIPSAVREELLDQRAPHLVRQWIAQPPMWLSVHSVSPATDPGLIRLHSGEREAIELALQCSADLILLDDKTGRQMATERKLPVAGLLGVVATAADRGLIHPVSVIDKLRKTSFRATPRLLRGILKRHRFNKDQ